jgi:hypothetical protein
MARSKRKLAGVGAIGKAKARYFHPKNPVKEKLQELYEKHEFTNVLIVGKGVHRVNKKDQKCYECRIPDIDESIVFKLVCSHLSVTQSPNEPFPDEVTTTPVAPAADQNFHLRVSQTNEPASFSGNYSDPDDRAAAIATLRAEGIEVDDKDVLPENAVPASAPTGKWEKPRTCPRRADPNIRNVQGSWKSKSWSVIREMDHLSIFRM